MAQTTDTKQAIENPEQAVVSRKRGVNLGRLFTRPGVDPMAEIEWDLRTAVITGEDGRVVFEQKDVEVPRAWSQTATNVVVSKYFRGPLKEDPRDATSPSARPRCASWYCGSSIPSRDGAKNRRISPPPMCARPSAPS